MRPLLASDDNLRRPPFPIFVGHKHGKGGINGQQGGEHANLELRSMNPSNLPRVKSLDTTFVRDRLVNRLKDREETLQRIRDGSIKLLQWEMSGHTSHCAASGFYQFALGHSFQEVRQSFSEAAAASLKVMELRGSEDSFPVLMVSIDPTKPEDDPAAITSRWRDPPGTKDYSLGNSRNCLEGIFYAWVGGEYGIVDQLAKLMWDPPKARYIGPKSEVCTTNQLHLSYAVKYLLLESPEEARKELARIPPRPRSADPETPYLAKMVRGLVENHCGFFTDGLQELLFWHQKQVDKPWNLTNPEMYFCLPAVALCILALRRCLIEKTDLLDDPYLPLELI
jgi:hypothetical protein